MCCYVMMLQLSSYAYELLHPLLYLGYVTKSMLTQACGNITVVSDVAQCADAVIVIEAVRRECHLRRTKVSSCGSYKADEVLVALQIPENLEAKVKLFKTLEQHCSASTILATNTIELPIDSIQYVLLTMHLCWLLLLDDI